MLRSTPLAARATALIAAALVLFAALWTGRAPSGTVESDLRDALRSDGTEVQVYHPGGEDCAMCHTSRGGAARSGLWMTTTASPESAQGGTLGPASTRACLSCHDGTVSHRIYQNGVQGEHPVGTDYFQAYDRAPRKFVSPYNSRIHLEDGRIGCVSCHAVHERTGYAANARPNNCGICHTY